MTKRIQKRKKQGFLERVEIKGTLRYDLSVRLKLRKIQGSETATRGVIFSAREKRKSSPLISFVGL